MQKVIHQSWHAVKERGAEALPGVVALDFAGTFTEGSYEGTAFAGWLLRSADDKEWGRWERPNGTAVELLMATPLFADELAFGMENGTTDLISRLQRARFLDRIWPSRRSVVS